jgi:hypothetical protein
MAERDWLADDPLGVLITRVRGTVRVELVGEADIWGWRRLQMIGDTVLDNPDPPVEVVLDMRKLRFACIRSLRLIAEFCDRFQEAGILTYTTGLNRSVERAAALGEVRLPAGPPTTSAVDLPLLERADVEGRSSVS